LQAVSQSFGKFGILLESDRRYIACFRDLERALRSISTAATSASLGFTQNYALVIGFLAAIAMEVIIIPV
jgi:hypothetical protein